MALATWTDCSSYPNNYPIPPISIDEINKLVDIKLRDIDYTNIEMRLNEYERKQELLDNKLNELLDNQSKLMVMLEYLVDRKNKFNNSQYGMRG